MRKSVKKILVISTAAVLALGAVGLTSCGKKFTPLSGEYESASPAVSNGGFVVEYGNYVYFINGSESYEADNTYTVPVKGALMRIKKTDLLARNNVAETVIPSLMVAGDTSAGIYIYNNRVYYATPNNTKSMSGEVEKGYLDFKSAKLDGSDIKSYFRVEDNSTVYRYVEAGEGDAKSVYLLYYENTTIHSYNTSNKVDTTLAKDVSAYTLDTSYKTDFASAPNPVVYYTMSVVDNIDSETPTSQTYNQIYRVRADATAAPEGYDYTWDKDYLDKHDGEAPYVNLGEIVLDGVKKSTDGEVTRFSPDYASLTDAEKNEVSVSGYTYTLQSYANGGIYFTRKENTGIDNAKLYYLPESELDAAGWNSIKGNSALQMVANSSETTNASASALFYMANGHHHYIYVDGAEIVRAEVGTDGTVLKTQPICKDASGAELLYLDNTNYYPETQDGYGYVWFTRSNGSGYSVERAVYTGNLKAGAEHDYDVLTSDGNQDTLSKYKPVKLYNLQHKSGWYKYEVLPSLGMVFIADAEPVVDTSYNYVACVPVNSLNNAELEALNDKYNEIKSSDAKIGYLAKVAKTNASLSSALNYYFMTGKTDVLYSNMDAAKEHDLELYTEDDVKEFASFALGAQDTADTSSTKGKFIDGNGVSYRTRSYFITALGKVSDSDSEAMEKAWSNYLEHYTEPEKEETGLKDWEWALIGVSIGIVVIGAALGVYFYLRHKKKVGAKDKKPEKMRVDTTDDKEVDVYKKAAPEEESAQKAEESEQEAPAESESAPEEESNEQGE